MNGFVDATGRAIQFVGDRNVTRTPWIPRAAVARSANATMLAPGVGIAPLALAAGTSPAISRLSGMGIDVSPTVPGSAAPAADSSEPNWIEKITGVSITGRDVQGGSGATISAPPSTILFSLLAAGIGAQLARDSNKSILVFSAVGGIAGFIVTQAIRASGRHGF